MKYKVAYNACFGGFSLSLDAAKEYAKRKGLSYSMGDIDVAGFEYIKVEGDFDVMRPKCRHDPDLISVIEEMGEAASGYCASLEIVEVSGPYIIDEYDGNENVVEPGDTKWIDPSEVK